MEKCDICKENDRIREEYPVQDVYWPSRRWKEGLADYVDMSGGCTCDGDIDFNPEYDPWSDFGFSIGDFI